MTKTDQRDNTIPGAIRLERCADNTRYTRAASLESAILVVIERQNALFAPREVLLESAVEGDPNGIIMPYSSPPKFVNGWLADGRRRPSRLMYEDSEWWGFGLAQVGMYHRPAQQY